MTLSTSQYLESAPETCLQHNTELGWRDLRKGLALVVAGYFILIGGGLLGVLLVRLGMDDGPVVRYLGHSMPDQEGLLMVGVLTLGVTALCSYGLVLAGQWRCLMYAPQAHHAKELMYVCFNCLLLGSILNGVGVYFNGARTYAALQDGPAAVASLDLWTPGNLLQLASALLGLLGTLVFSQFLRGVAGCFQARDRQKSVDLNLLFVGLMLGGSLGTLFCVQRIGLRIELLPWLAAGWLLCFAWHLYLVGSVYTCVGDGLRRGTAAYGAWTREDQPGTITIHTLSGLHRLARGVGR